jgi:hypothetical protein
MLCGFMLSQTELFNIAPDVSRGPPLCPSLATGYNASPARDADRGGPAGVPYGVMYLGLVAFLAVLSYSIHDMLGAA